MRLPTLPRAIERRGVRTVDRAQVTGRASGVSCTRLLGRRVVAKTVPQSTQFTTLRPGICRKCRTLRVTSTASWVSTILAMSMSARPIFR